MHEIITATDGKLNPQAYVTEDELSSVLQRWEDAVKIKEIDYLALVNKLNPLSYGWEDVLETVTVTNSVGDEVEVGERYTGMTDAFDAEMQKTVLKIGEENQIPVHSGVFMEVTGPQFETPAEIKMYRSFGADAIAMSLADEVLAARQMNMKVCAINCISKEALIKSTCAAWRRIFSSGKPKSCRNTDVFQRFLARSGRKKARQDVRGDLFSASLIWARGWKRKASLRTQSRMRQSLKKGFGKE